MSHELRTPMNGVLGLVEALITDDGLAPEQLESLRTVRSSGRSLVALLDDLLDLSRVESGRLELESEPVSPERLVRSVVALLSQRAATRGVSLRVEVAPDVGWGRGDPARLRQVVLNLVGNAIKFTEDGSVRIQVERSGREVVLAVVDTGIGIPEDALERLFEAFVQADASTTRRFGGSGLGLAISHRLVEAMGGSIAVQSQVGVGSRFTVRVPLPPTAAPASVESRAEGPRPRSGLRVLVAEDHPVNQVVAKRMLEQLGAVVRVVVDGEQALDAMDAEPFDVVLMDLHMPHMDGLQGRHPQRLPRDVSLLHSFCMDRCHCYALQTGATCNARGGSLSRAKTPIVVLLTGLAAVACPPPADDTDPDTDDTDTATDQPITVEVADGSDPYVGVPVVFHDSEGVALGTVATGPDGLASFDELPQDGGGASVVLSGENEIITRMGLRPGDTWVLEPDASSTQVDGEMPPTVAGADRYRVIDCAGWSGFDPEDSDPETLYLSPLCERQDGSTTLLAQARDADSAPIAWSLTEAQARPDATVTFPEWDTRIDTIDVVLDGTRDQGQAFVQSFEGRDGIRVNVDSTDVSDGGGTAQLGALPALPETLIRAAFEADTSGTGLDLATSLHTQGFGESTPSQVRFDLDSDVWPTLTDTGLIPDARELTWDASAELTGAEMLFASLRWKDEGGQTWRWDLEAPLDDPAGPYLLPDMPEVSLSDDTADIPEGPSVWLARHSQLDFDDLRLAPYPAQFALIVGEGSGTFTSDLALARGN